MANELTRAIMANLAGVKPAARPESSPCGAGNLSPREEKLLTGLIGGQASASPCPGRGSAAGSGPAAGRRAISLSDLARLHGHGR